MSNISQRRSPLNNLIALSYIHLKSTAFFYKTAYITNPGFQPCRHCQLIFRIIRTYAAITVDVKIDETLTHFCRDSGCENYGLAINCPPHVSGPAGFKKLLKDDTQAVVFKIDVLIETLLSKENLDAFRSLHKIAANIEKTAIEKGYNRSKAFAGGSCKPLFCQKHPDCLVLSENGKCRHPHIARSSMSGFGINVSQLAKAAGWQMERITSETDPETVKTGMLCGLVLIGG